MDINDKLLPGEFELILEALHYFKNEHPELAPIIKKLESNICIEDYESDLIGVAAYNYIQLCNSKNKKSFMRLAVAFDKYGRELQLKLEEFAK